MQNNVSRTETNILKGIAIIMMLWLHLFSKGNEIGNYTDFNLANEQPLAYFLTRLCTPVSFFLILSGYGLASTYTIIIDCLLEHKFHAYSSYTSIIG